MNVCFYICIPEAHGGGDESKGEVGHHADEGDVSDGEESHQDRPEGDAGVPGVLPVQQGILFIKIQPHLKK